MEVIEVHVSAGDKVNVDDELITLETDKATMDVPSTAAGTIEKVLVSVGDKVSKGSPVAEIDAEATLVAPASQAATPAAAKAPVAEPIKAAPPSQPERSRRW